MKHLGTAAAIALFLACSRSDPPAGAAPALSETTTSGNLTSEELDILEAVFRFQLGRGTQGTYPERFLLSLSGTEKHWRDPPDELLARFRGTIPPVEPISVAGPEASVDVHGGGPPGIVLCLKKIRRLEEATAEVHGDYYSHLRASADVYRVERVAGTWVVVKDWMESIY